MANWRWFCYGLLFAVLIWWITKIPPPEVVFIEDPAAFIHQYWLNLVENGDDAVYLMLQDVQNTGGSLRNYLYNLFGYWPE